MNIIYCIHKPYEDEEIQQVFKLNLDTLLIEVYDSDGNLDQHGYAGENDPILTLPYSYPRISEEEFLLYTMK